MAIRINSFSHWVLWEMASLFEHIGTVQDGINTLSRPNVLLDHQDAVPLQITHGDIRFEQVDFSYGLARPVIHQLSMHIRAGEKIGLVGRSGAGKSSLVNILLRTYDIDSGRLLIDGQNIAQVTQDSLRAQIGLVTQDTSLLHRSVRDNIVYGRPDATEADMIGNNEADALDAANRLARQLSTREVVAAAMTNEQAADYAAGVKVAVRALSGLIKTFPIVEVSASGPRTPVMPGV